jgi:hypothetical protein
VCKWVNKIVVYLMSSWVNWVFCGTSVKGPRVPKKAQFTHERVEYIVFLFDEPLKGSKSLKIFKFSLTFRFDKLSHLSKSFTQEKILKILTISNKKKTFSSNLFLPHRLFIIMIMYVILVIKIEYKNSFCISIPK